MCSRANAASRSPVGLPCLESVGSTWFNQAQYASTKALGSLPASAIGYAFPDTSGADLQRGVQTMKDKSIDRARDISLRTDSRSRRRFLAVTTTAMAATVAGGLTNLWGDEGRELGSPMRPYGERSAFEKVARRNSRP